MSVRTSNDNGFILVFVVLVVGILALVAAVFQRTVQSYVRETANAIQMAHLEFAADAGLNIAVLDLVSERDISGYSRRFAINGTETACRLEDRLSLFIRLYDAGGKINLNLADAPLFASLFMGLGETAEQATTNADRILDFRDNDDEKRVNGAERDDYIAAGQLWGPKNAAFEAREELHQVLGFDQTTIEAFWPYITIYSDSAGVNPSTISPDLANIIAKGYSQLPDGGPNAKNSELTASGIPLQFAVSAPPHVYEATVIARMDDGTTFVRDAGFDIPRARKAQTNFKLWQRSTLPVARRIWPDAATLAAC